MQDDIILSLILSNVARLNLVNARKIVLLTWVIFFLKNMKY